ncbi:MAG: zf-TFIIB domain-containing protein, partial [Candidatus Eisenbacteria bacterium]|nr:zf-TFIIB domain-containing protein [Candidatus Eisenbacteria bacterium]
PDFLVPDDGPARRRRELDRERADRELDAGDEVFWMVCPKCGDHLSEHEFDGVHVERCEACGGLWIDKGESDLLLSLAADDRALARRARGILQ